MNSIDVEEYLKREADSIPNSEKKYYKPDEYYQIKSYGNTMLEECVIPFEERKRCLFLLKMDYMYQKYYCYIFVLSILILKMGILATGGINMAFAMLVKC